MHQRLLTVAALAVLASFPGVAFAQGCDPAALFEDRVGYTLLTARSVAMGDLDGDGHADLAVVGLLGREIRLLLNNGDGTFRSDEAYAIGPSPTAVIVGDLDGDGDGDLVAADAQSHDVRVLLNNGDGTFASHVRYGVGNAPHSVAMGDLDGDGAPDLATANQGAHNVSVLFNNGDGTFAAHVPYGVGLGPISVAIGDLDGDGAPDLATANSFNSTLSTLLNNGDGTFAPDERLDVSTTPISVAMGDLDGDDDRDLVAMGYNDNLASVLLNNGDGTFAPRVDYGTGREPYAVAIGDLNSDGIPDLATANSSASAANRVSVLVGNGDGTFAPRTNYRVGDGPLSIAMGDLNGDGALDLATANFSVGNVSVLLNRCFVPPTITRHPDSLMLPAGGGVAEFGVAASGTSGFRYQWQRDGVDLVDGGGVSGSMTPTLTIDATIEDVAAYDVVVTNAGGDAVSDPAFLAVKPNPCPADFDGDGSLTLFDFLEFSNAFAGGCP